MLNWISETQVMAKRRARSQTGSLILGTKSQESTDLLACRWCVTYHWKTLDKGYNFALNCIIIKGLHEKLLAPKVVGVPTVRISGVPGKKTIWMWPLGRGVEYIIRGKVVTFPKCGLW